MFPRPSGIITLTTDFGQRDPYVGILEGAVLRASDKPRIVHLCHEVAQFDVAGGAFMLWSAIARFPAGTVHIGVVDPGVGTERSLLAVCAHGQYWLVPDNGMIASVLANAASSGTGDAGQVSEVRRLDLEHLRIRPQSRTFDGRDVLAPVAAWLATGRYGFSAMGPIVKEWHGNDPVFAGEARIVHVDRYGNLISNVKAEALSDGSVVKVGEHVLSVQATYGDADEGSAMAYVGSFGLVEIAVRNGNAAAQLGLQRGATIQVSEA